MASSTAPQTFFNLGSFQAETQFDTNALFGPSTAKNVATNWKTFEDQPISPRSLMDVFANRTPVVRVKEFLTQDECERMLQVVRTHKLVSMPDNTIITHELQLNQEKLNRVPTMLRTHGQESEFPASHSMIILAVGN
jgi:hypothetical protein